jgi:hypothetical protein
MLGAPGNKEDEIPEVEITEEMIRAGVEAFPTYDRRLGGDQDEDAVAVIYEAMEMARRLHAKRTTVIDVDVQSHDGNFNLTIRVPDLGGDESALRQMTERLLRLFEDAAETLRSGNLEVR